MATEQSTTYTLTLKGEGIDVKKSISQDVAFGVMSLLMGGPSHAIAFQHEPEQSSSSAGRGNSKKASIQEYLSERGAKRNPEKILAVAAYMADEEAREEFGAEDIKERLKRAREKLPANFSRDFNTVIASGWINQDDADPSLYWVTTTGRKAIDSNFSAETRKTSTRPSRKRGKTPSEGGNLSTDTYKPKLDKELNLNGLAKFYSEFKPRSHSERILIFTKYLQTLGIETATADQIFTCYMKLKERMPKFYLQAFRDAHGSKYGFIEYKSPSHIQLTHIGENHFNQELARVDVES